MTCHGTILGSAVLTLLLAAGAAAGQAKPQEAPRQQQDQPVEQPHQFVPKAIAAGLYEVQAAQVAVERAQNVKIRDFASKMLAEHRQVNQELTLLANQRQWKMPSEPDAAQKGMLDRLSKTPDEQFDREYTQQQLQVHQEAVALFQRQAESGADERLQSWASQKLETLRKHLFHAEQMVREDAADRQTPNTRSDTTP